MIVFDNWDHKSRLELSGDKRVSQHRVEEVCKSNKYIEGGMVKMFDGNAVFICTFAFLHARDGIDNVERGYVCWFTVAGSIVISYECRKFRVKLVLKFFDVIDIVRS